MKKAEIKRVPIFRLEIETLGNKIYLFVHTKKFGGYVEYNTFRDADTFNDVLNDLTIASSFQADIFLKYLRRQKKKKITFKT